MEFFRFVPPTLVALSTCFVLVAAIPMPFPLPQEVTPADVTRLEAAPAPAPAPVSFSRALPSHPASSRPRQRTLIRDCRTHWLLVVSEPWERWLLEVVSLEGTATSASDQVWGRLWMPTVKLCPNWG